MRTIAFDIGEKRIGVALSDESNTLSFPLKVIMNSPGVKNRIHELVNEYEIGVIVIGLPYNLKGKEDFAAKKIKDFVNENFEDINIPVVFVDERFTSKISQGIIAGNIHAEKTITKKKKEAKKNIPNKGDIDMLSAALILENYLEKNRYRI